MIDELALHLDEYLGSPSHAQCFAHILNLVVKSMMRQFDVPLKKQGNVVDEVSHESHDLAGDTELEELPTHEEREGNEDEDNVGSNTEDWIDKWVEMLEEDVRVLDESVKPIHFLLTKVSCLRNHVQFEKKTETLTTRDTSLDPENCFQNEKPDHQRPTSVVPHPGRTLARQAGYAP